MNVLTRVILPVSILIFLSGCNTYYNKSFQEISVHTPGVENVDCILQTDKNKYSLLAPGTVTVNRSSYDLEIICEKANYVSVLKKLKPRASMATIPLNVANGIVPGVLYDVASNSIYDYPQAVIMKMKPKTGLKKHSVIAYLSENNFTLKKKTPVHRRLPPKLKQEKELESKVKAEEIISESLVK